MGTEMGMGTGRMTGGHWFREGERGGEEEGGEEEEEGDGEGEGWKHDPRRAKASIEVLTKLVVGGKGREMVGKTRENKSLGVCVLYSGSERGRAFGGFGVSYGSATDRVFWGDTGISATFRF